MPTPTSVFAGINRTVEAPTFSWALPNTFATSSPRITLATVDPEWSNGWSHLWKEIGNAHEAAVYCRPAYTPTPYLRKKPAARKAHGIRGQSWDWAAVDEVASYRAAVDEVASYRPNLAEFEDALERESLRFNVYGTPGIAAWIPATTYEDSF